MQSVIDIWRLHGYWILFFWVLADQFGVGPPSFPVLIAAGAFVVTGQASVPLVLFLAIAASLISDIAWYVLGTMRGKRVVRWLCRISFQPDSCVNRTENTFARWGLRSLLVAKFVPGISTVAPPLAGAFRLSVLKFVGYDTVGALLWSGSGLLLGYVFSGQLERLAASVSHAGRVLGVALVVLLLLAYPVIKYIRRKRTFARSRAARITPEDLKRKLDGGSRLIVLDVRHPLDVLSSPYVIAGAMRIPLGELQARTKELALDLEIVAYCTCPGDASAVRALQTLQAAGLKGVKVLHGGLDAWQQRGFPVAPFEVPPQAAAKAAWAF